ncbi:4921_t:CDS:1, partial [Racocetra fulgida]
VPLDIRMSALESIKEKAFFSNTKRKLDDDQSDEDFYNDEIDENKIAQCHNALIRLFVCCGIPFHIVDHPFFKDFVKTL